MIRLVTYSTPAYELRRRILHASALLSGCAEHVSSWSPSRLNKSGFAKTCPGIRLSERGGGWWAWKPFVILKELEGMKDGDYLLYCDTGRIYPFKILDRPLTSLVLWMKERGQFCLPGVEIPWNGPMSRWTKRDAFVLTGCDDEGYYRATPIQASFSLWKVCEESRGLAAQWLEWCSDRRLVTDDPNRCGHDNLPDFVDHRHDQCLLSLLCIKNDISGISMGNHQPDFDEKNPANVAENRGESKAHSIRLALLRKLASILAAIERAPRRLFSAIRALRSGSSSERGTLEDAKRKEKSS